MAKKKCLVIGCAGFIGRHVGKRIFEANYLDTGVDRNPLQPPRWMNRFAAADVSSAAFDDILKDCRPDITVNCAGTASVLDSVRNPKADFQDNVLSTFSILDALIKNSPQSKFVFLSSAAVYGKPEVLP